MHTFQEYIGDMIDNSRRDTQNAADIPDEVISRGIQTQDILRYYQDAQSALEAAVTSLYPMIFLETRVMAIDASKDAYTINDNVYLGIRIVKVEYSRTGKNEDYCDLAYKQNYQISGCLGFPKNWSRLNSSIILENNPKNLGGYIRVTYQKKLDKLALRVSQIQSPSGIVLSADNKQVAAVSVVQGVEANPLITAAVASKKSFCFSRETDGKVTIYNMMPTAYNTGTGSITFMAVDVADEQNLPAAGDWLTIGDYTTTHSKLPDGICSTYLTEYVNIRIKMRESSTPGWQSIRSLIKNTASLIAEAYSVKDSLALQEIPLGDYGKNMLTIEGSGGY